MHWRKILDTQRITQNLNSSDKQDKQLQRETLLLNRYMIMDILGLGGMSSVYRARDMHFPNAMKIVAVKEMINQAPDPLVRQTIVQNFEREANILVTLSHPSIPKIFDYFTHNDRSYLVIEYVSGKDLEVYMNESPDFVPQEQAIQWGIELCDVLSYLHDHKPEMIIFRDMKPSNIMVNQQGHIVLVDFGIAKLFKEGQKGTMIGTEGYSPPEQYRGEASPQADIYSLGATLHHLLTRRDPRLEPPFTFTERPVRGINPSVSIELEALINTALQYNPQDRFQSAKQMKEALLMVAKKTGALTRGAFNTVSFQESSVKPLWSFSCEDEIRGTPNCYKGVVYVGSYDNNLYALDAASGKFVWKFPTDGGLAGQPMVDDNAIYVGSEDQKLYAVSPRTGKSMWTYTTDGPIRSSPRMADDFIITGSDDGYLHAVVPKSNQRLWAVDAGAAIRSTPFISRDYLYFGSESGEVFCADLHGQTRWRFRAKRAVTSSPLVSDGVVYFASLDSNVYALDAKTGWAIWRFRLGKGSVSSPCKIDNYLFVGSADHNIYCIETGSTKEVWRYKTDHQVSGTPVIFKDSLYCGSADGKLYCLEYRTGRLRWTFQSGGPITGAIAVSDEIIYFGSSDHSLYALMA
jgi:serine/threonine protein kinase